MYSVKPACSSLFLRIFKAFNVVQTPLILNSFSYCILIYLSVLTSATALFFSTQLFLHNASSTQKSMRTSIILAFKKIILTYLAALSLGCGMRNHYCSVQASD